MTVTVIEGRLVKTMLGASTRIEIIVKISRGKDKKILRTADNRKRLT